MGSLTDRKDGQYEESPLSAKYVPPADESRLAEDIARQNEQYRLNVLAKEDWERAKLEHERMELREAYGFLDDEPDEEEQIPMRRRMRRKKS